MATWAEFEGAAPQLAGKGRALQYQYGPLLGYLAIVRPKERIFGATPVSRSTPSLRRMLTTIRGYAEPMEPTADLKAAIIAAAVPATVGADEEQLFHFLINRVLVAT